MPSCALGKQTGRSLSSTVCPLSQVPRDHTEAPVKAVCVKQGCICLAGFGLPGSVTEYKVIRVQCLATNTIGSMLCVGLRSTMCSSEPAPRGEGPASVPVLRRSKWTPLSSAAHQQLFNVIPNDPPE